MSEFAVRLPCSSAKGWLEGSHSIAGQGGIRFCCRTGSPDSRCQAGRFLRRKTLAASRRAPFIENDQPEIILVAGGTDHGGDTETQLHNARMLAEASRYATYTEYGVPVVYAGNQDIREQIENIFRHHDVDIRITDKCHAGDQSNSTSK